MVKWISRPPTIGLSLSSFPFTLVSMPLRALSSSRAWLTFCFPMAAQPKVMAPDPSGLPYVACSTDVEPSGFGTSSVERVGSCGKSALTPQAFDSKVTHGGDDVFAGVRDSAMMGVRAVATARHWTLAHLFRLSDGAEQCHFSSAHQASYSVSPSRVSSGPTTTSAERQPVRSAVTA